MGFSTIANAAPNKKFEFLLHFFDMNEAAFAYHRHCLSTSEDINPKFLKTLDVVADELFKQAQIDEPDMMSAEYIKTKILERRYNLQYKLDHAHIKRGCHSQSVGLAKAHYEEFSQFSIREVHIFIDEQTGG